VLGPSYQEFAQQQSREAEAIARTLGKGKRIRRQVNYAEQQAMLELEARVCITVCVCVFVCVCVCALVCVHWCVCVFLTIHH